MKEAEEAGATARSPRVCGTRVAKPEPEAQSPVHKLYYEPNITEGRKRSNEGITHKTRRGRQRRQSMSPENKLPRTKRDPGEREKSPWHLRLKSPGNRGRRSSQETMCECWDCRRKPEHSR